VTGPLPGSAPVSLTGLRARVAAVQGDDRFGEDHQGRGVRALALAMLWATAVHPQVMGPSWWSAVGQALGSPAGQAAERVRHVIGADVPRYRPPTGDGDTCQAPGPGGVCGRPAAQAGRVSDPGTGRWRMVGHCHRHLGRAGVVEAAERARQASGRLPVPDPNAGGLLAVHVPFLDWDRTYAWADPSWTPPPGGPSHTPAPRVRACRRAAGAPGPRRLRAVPAGRATGGQR
jgi:hypothetical protein